MTNKLGIYVHIPFCRSKCDYCDFYSCATTGDQLSSEQGAMDAYLKALLHHFKETAPFARSHQVDSIYIGGGTPSYFGGKRLRELLGQLMRRYHVSRDAEITVECNPDTVNERLMKILVKAGVNRISLGVQSAVESELRAVGRIHNFEQVKEAIRLAKSAKLNNISLDIIYGLPGQTPESLAHTLDAVIALDPAHISCYGLKVEDGTQLARRVAEGETLPDDDTQADMYLFAVNKLAQGGYRQYEISNFSRPGTQSRHNLKYWMSRDYLGFGPGAHSYFDGRRYSIIKDTAAYIHAMTNGGELLDENEVLDQRSKACEYLMLRLRTVRGIEEWEYRREFFMNFDPIERKLFELEVDGYVVRDDRRWHLTPKGFLLSSALIGLLLDVQEEQKLENLIPRLRREEEK